MWDQEVGKGELREVVSESPPSQSLTKLGLGCRRLTDP